MEQTAQTTAFCALFPYAIRNFKGLTYKVAFQDDNTAIVSVGDFMIYINFESQKCSNNKGLKNFGSDIWGQDVSVDWDNAFIKQ